MKRKPSLWRDIVDDLRHQPAAQFAAAMIALTLLAVVLGFVMGSPDGR